jgi:hypothetical protein
LHYEEEFTIIRLLFWNILRFAIMINKDGVVMKVTLEHITKKFPGFNKKQPDVFAVSHIQEKHNTQL